jgi:D-threo-aldose 1-dehydrogenase
VAISGLYSPVAPRDADELLRDALNRGIRYFDTAPMYGSGLGERRLGHMLEFVEDRAKVVVSTKVGRLLRAGTPPESSMWHGRSPFTQHYDYSYDGIYRSIEDSQQRLGLDRIDIVHIHDIGVYTHGDRNPFYLRQLRGGGYLALTELVAAGVIGGVGIGVNDTASVTEVLEDFDLNFALLAGRFTLLEQPDPSFFEHLQRRSVHVIAAGIYNSGALAGGKHYDYGAAAGDVLERVRVLEDICRGHGMLLQVVAAQFVARQPMFASMLIGPRSLTELDQSLAALQAPIPKDLWEDLAESGAVPARWVQAPMTARGSA